MKEDNLRFISSINVVAGLWLAFSPLWINYTVAGNAWQQVILGAAITFLGLGRMESHRSTWASIGSIAAGAYLIVAPWVVGAAGGAAWNQTILGIIIATVGIISATSGSVAAVSDGESSAETSRQNAMSFGERIDRNRK